MEVAETKLIHWKITGTFKEESTKLADFTENENKALQELKSLI